MMFATLVLAVTASGATGSTTAVSVFTVKPSNGDSGYGAAVEHFWTSSLSAVLAISAEPTGVTKFGSTSFGRAPFTSFEDVHPIDLAVRYSFAKGSRINPYAGIGMRYVRSGSLDNYRPALVAGARLKLSDRIAIEADWKRLYNQRNSTFPETIRDGEFGEGGEGRLSLGLAFAF
jgi:hypothetical protein